MTIPSTSPAIELPEVIQRSNELLAGHQQTIWRRTDRLFAGLLGFEWIAGIILALWRSPTTWSGPAASVHPHVYSATILGALCIVLPIYMAMTRPGFILTRHLIAVSQMLMSGLLIHLGDGRIEMHFHIFGSLAFLAFYRDWRVLVSASGIVAIDHLVRGMFLPQSVYGAFAASNWRTLEHAGWVVFENLFLVASCVQAVREMRGIADHRALLEHNHRDVGRQVQERTQQLNDAQASLMKAARSAGMAEIATSVLHNVGNVLNSVNVSATIVADRLKNSEISTLAKVSELITQNRGDLANYLTHDERGRLVPDFVTQLAVELESEQKMLIGEVNGLAKGIEHIKQIVAAQQNMAKKVTLRTAVDAAELVESALAMQGAASMSQIEIVRNYDKLPRAMLDEHQVLQILINLISNATQAVRETAPGKRQISLSVCRAVTENQTMLRYQVCDNGMGIAAENIGRIFSHGFTTKENGHGFGLHSAANAACEMGGSLTVKSEGINLGAAFTLEVPITFAEESVSCNR